MATIKSYTDIEQSKKLAEILPLESADMYYPWYIEEDRNNIKSGHRISIPSVGNFIHKVNILPCWSLVALIEVLPSIEGFKPVIDLDINLIRYEGNYRDELCFNRNNLVDACYEMIIKLNELNLL